MKKLFLFSIPMSICNFRCSYCYLAQRPSHYEGKMPDYKYSPEQFGKAMSVKRIGGIAYGNFTATGETLLMRDLGKYIKAFVEQGHYAEIVTNLTITPALEEILSWDKELLKRIEFKCSFHYLELKKKNMLKVFSNNVHRIWEAGASANIEMTPADDVVPFIEEIKAFCIKEFGAFPHLTIARDDRTSGIDYLTDYSADEYDKIWGQFESDFWKFKKTIFGVKQKGFCYAGAWSYYVDLTTGEARQCYCGESLGNIFENPEEKLPEKPIGKCRLPHCFNGHALLTLGLIPSIAAVHYGDIRNRNMKGGKNEWLQSDLLNFFNGRVFEDNNALDRMGEKNILMRENIKDVLNKVYGELVHRR